MRKFWFSTVLAGAFTVAVGVAPAAQAANGNLGNVVVLNSADASISLIDPVSLTVTETFPVGKEPHHLMATPDNKSLIVANSISNNLVFLDPKSGHIQRWIENIEDPYQIGYSP